MLRKSRIADELRKQCESIKVKDIANGVEGCADREAIEP